VAALRAAARPQRTVFLIQGWLRHLALGTPVRARGLHEVPAAMWEAFGSADAVVVSTEDLSADPADPFAQAAAVRERLGPGPVLVLTLGTEGYLLDDPAADRVVASVPRRVVEGVPSVGAGDTFGAVLALHLARGEAPTAAAAAATESVIGMLETRRA
jgi:sugar/nucleoside kinase (ribokinase family)